MNQQIQLIIEELNKIQTKLGKLPEKYSNMVEEAITAIDGVIEIIEDGAGE